MESTDIDATKRVGTPEAIARNAATQLVPVEAVLSAIQEAARMQEERRVATERSARVREQLRLELQSRLRGYKLAAAIVAVVAAVTILLGRDIPADVFGLQELPEPDVSAELAQVGDWAERVPQDYVVTQRPPAFTRDSFELHRALDTRSIELATSVSEVMAGVAAILYSLGREAQGDMFLFLSELELVAGQTLEARWAEARRSTEEPESVEALLVGAPERGDSALGRGLGTSVYTLLAARQTLDFEASSLTSMYRDYLNEAREELREDLRGQHELISVTLMDVASAANQLRAEVSREIQRLTNEVAVRNRVIAALSSTVRVTWVWSWLIIGALGPVATLWLRRRITDIEEEIRELEWHTETKTQLYAVLADMLGDKIRQRWTQDDLIGSVAGYQCGKGKRYARVVMALGGTGFAQFVIDRARLAGVIAISDMIVGGAVVECYDVMGVADGEA